MLHQHPIKTPYTLNEPNAPTATDDQALLRALAEAWAVVHYAERRGYRDISDALHQAIARTADSDASPKGAAHRLDDAREHALGRLDVCGALADDTDFKKIIAAAER